MALYAIGDIHGSYIALKTLLQKLSAKSKEHTYIFLGDYVNKGDDSNKVLSYLIKFSKKNNCIFLRGNHDIIMLSARFSKENFKRWIQSGGDKTLESYNALSCKWHKKIPQKHWQFLEKTLAFYQINNRIFVHAGLEEGISLKKQNPEYLFWNKNQQPVRYKKGKTVFCGHTNQKSGEIGNFGHTILLDTFAWGSGYLTALDVDSGKYFQASNSGELRKRKLDLRIKDKAKKLELA